MRVVMFFIILLFYAGGSLRCTACLLSMRPYGTGGYLFVPTGLGRSRCRPRGCISGYARWPDRGL